MAIGVLLGSSLMMSQMCLTLFAVYLGLADNINDDDQDGVDGPYRGLSAFYFFQFVTFLVSGALRRRTQRLCVK